MKVGGREEEREGEGKGREDEVIHRRWMRMFGRGENFEKRKKEKEKRQCLALLGESVCPPWSQSLDVPAEGKKNNKISNSPPAYVMCDGCSVRGNSSLSKFKRWVGL